MSIWGFKERKSEIKLHKFDLVRWFLLLLPLLFSVAVQTIFRYDGFYGQPDISLLIFGMIALFIIYSLTLACRQKWLVALSFLMPGVELAAALMVPAYDDLRIAAARSVERFKFASFEGKKAYCKAHARLVSSGGTLGVCWVFVGDPITYAVVYDSTGSILSTHTAPSEAWIKAAQSLQPYAPFGQLGYGADSMGHGFYRMTFGVYSDPEDFWLSWPEQPTQDP